MQTDSELESDTSSINDGVPGCGVFSSSNTTTTTTTNNLVSNNPLSREQLDKRIDSLMQENRVLKIEIGTYKIRIKGLQDENKELRKASVNIQARAEQEEEYISNKLLKKIQSLKKEKETLANNYEREEEYLTNDLSRKLNQLRNEKVQLEQTLEQEQEHMVNKLMRKIEKLEAETSAKQSNLEQLRREKIELENTLEQEQESLVNRLWKRMERLEAEKRLLQEKLDQPVSAPMSPRNTALNAPNNSGQIINSGLPPFSNIAGSTAAPPPISTLNLVGLGTSSEQAATLTDNIINLRREVNRLKANLEKAERDHKENMAKLVKEEKQIREENIRLQRRLQMEVDRREALCRHLSESESSLEMDDERHFNESTRVRTISSPIPVYVAGNNSQTIGVPATAVTSTTTASVNTSLTNPTNTSSTIFTQPLTHVERCPTCNQIKPMPTLINNPSSPPTIPPAARQQITSAFPATITANPTLAGSSSLSSSSSSINSSNMNKIHSNNQISQPSQQQLQNNHTSSSHSANNSMDTSTSKK